MNRIITLEDLVARDQQRNVEQWILWMCAKSIDAKKISQGWDGHSIEGEAALAFVNNGRWLARCKVCGNPMYVSWKTPIAYCVECGNGGIPTAWPVAFPPEREEIEAVLLTRQLEIPRGKFIRNDVEWALNSIPVIPRLRRNWRLGMTVQQLLEANEEALRGRQRR
jgi:hypothetical protein